MKFFNKTATKRRIILHTGLPKTATTAIQNSLFKNRTQMLIEDKVLYPSIAANHTNAICTLFMDNPTNHISLKMAGIIKPQEVIRLQKKTRATIQSEIESCGWETLILSAEGVSNFNIGECRKLYAWLKKLSPNIQVITFTRNPVGFTTSVSQQMIKGGDNLNNLTNNLPLPNHQGRLNNLIHAFGKHRLKIIPYEEAEKHSNGILGLFLDACNYQSKTTEQILTTQERSNESMSLQAAQIWSKLNELRPLFTGPTPGKNRTFNEHNYMMRIKGDKFQLPEPICKKILDLSTQDSQWLIDNFQIDYTQHKLPNRHHNQGLSDDSAKSLAILISDLLNVNQKLK